MFVVDTNVIAAGLMTSDPASPTAMVLDAMLTGELIYVISPELLAEYRAVLNRPKLKKWHGLSETEIDQVLSELVANAAWREPSIENGRGAPDPDDAHVWALLSDGSDVVLITGDRLLIERPRHGSSVVTPAVFCRDHLLLTKR